MTTVLASAKDGVMVADSNATDGDRVWTTKKVHRWRLDDSAVYVEVRK
jgi:hypothetical protein